jgi:hypothetical protein
MADPRTPPSSPPAGKDPTKGTWRWNGSDWEWFEAQENPVFGDPEVSQATKFWEWAKTQEGRRYIDPSKTGYYRAGSAAFGDPFYGAEGNIQVKNIYQMYGNGTGGGGGGMPPMPVASDPTGGGGAFSAPPSYTPFKLQGGSGFSQMPAFGMSGARGTDSLTPQLEQIRMQRLLRNYGGG